MKQDIHDDAEKARVSSTQPLLIPATPRETCRSIPLDWWAALKLWDDGLLSFNPETTAHLNEHEHAELFFIGSLVAAGSEPAFLNQILTDLSKPYAYQINLIYFDWFRRRWRLIPQPPSSDKREKMFSEWVQELEEARDVDTLEQMAGHIDYTLRELQKESNEFEDKNRESAREILKTTPGLAGELIDLWMSGEPDYENGLMGVPSAEDLEDMLIRSFKPVRSPDEQP